MQEKQGDEAPNKERTMAELEALGRYGMPDTKVMRGVTEDQLAVAIAANPEKYPAITALAERATKMLEDGLSEAEVEAAMAEQTIVETGPQSTIRFSDGTEGSTEQFTENGWDGRTEMPTQEAFGDARITPEPYGLDAIPDAMKAKADRLIEADREAEKADEATCEFNGDAECSHDGGGPTFTEEELAGIKADAEKLKLTPEGVAEEATRVWIENSPLGKLFQVIREAAEKMDPHAPLHTGVCEHEHIVDEEPLVKAIQATLPPYAFKSTENLVIFALISWTWTSPEGEFSVKFNPPLPYQGREMPTVEFSVKAMDGERKMASTTQWINPDPDEIGEFLEDLYETFGAL